MEILEASTGSKIAKEDGLLDGNANSNFKLKARLRFISKHQERVKLNLNLPVI